MLPSLLLELLLMWELVLLWFSAIQLSFQAVLHVALFEGHSPLSSLPEGTLDWWKKTVSASAAASVVETSLFPSLSTDARDIPTS